MPSSHPPRVRAFLDSMIKQLPRAPNNRASLESLRAMSTNELILAYLTWRTRLIPTRPRRISFWPGGVAPFRFQMAKPKLRPLLEKVVAGADLTPHLSDLVRRKGVVLPGARAADRRKDIDTVLTRHGLHHFHTGITGPGNPKGRSGSLIFAEVLENEFRIVAISDHRAFEPGSPEHRRFFRICDAYTAQDVPPGQAFMTNPVMSSGHPLILVLFALKCADEIRRLDPLMEDPAFIDELYNAQPISQGGHPIVRPENPSMAWHFEDLRFGIVDRTTMVFFCIFPFFTR